MILGFSVIFQYHIYEFTELVSYLRINGINCHFSAGGHYVSLRYEDLFKQIPSIDSIVRFEGEYTFLELVKCINSGKNWGKIKGLAFRHNGQVIVNNLRKPEKNIDIFPFPVRSPLEDYVLGRKFATILAGRGCIHNCSFCSNRQYYMHSGGPFRRLRSPVNVVGEMEFLYHEKDCSVFLFSDDDFPVKTSNGSEWIKDFCKELYHRKLVKKVMWKINCRPDEIDFQTFKLMKDHGLYLIFLGIDDGTEDGLLRLNKKMTVSKSIEGINVLKELNIGFDYGFMLFQPASTFRSLNENLVFLREICGDGYTPLAFLKLMPYSDTIIEKQLKKEGRLKGKPGFFDYDFLDDSLNHYYEFIRTAFQQWMTNPDGFVNISKWARNYVYVFSYFDQTIKEIESVSRDIRNTTSQGNLFLLDTMKKLAVVFESGKFDTIRHGSLKEYSENIKEKHDHLKEQMAGLIRKVCHFTEYQKLLQMITH